MKSFIKNWGLFLLVLAAFIILRVYFLTPVSVKGHSMDPTLNDGQKLLTLKTQEVDRFDIITLKEPDDLSKLAVKRVIGLPGETVEMHDDQLTIDGKNVPEPYLEEYLTLFAAENLAKVYEYNPDFQAIAENATNFTDDFTFTVPEDEYFVLGDNRLVSKDSRYFGFVKDSYVQGKVIWRYWPINEMKIFN